MNIVKTKLLKNGETQVTVNVKPGHKLVQINENALYRMPEPLSDHIYSGHFLSDSVKVHWCSISQQFSEV